MVPWFQNLIYNYLYGCGGDLFIITLFFFIAFVSTALPSEDPTRRPNDPLGVGGGILIVAPLLGGVTRKG